MGQGFATFDTAIGSCGVVWSDQGLIGVQLPERDAAALTVRIARRFASAEPRVAPPDVQAATAAIQALLQGKAINLNFVALDWDAVPAFNRKVYAIARRLPPGETTTYGAIAVELGGVERSRAVGQAMGQNPWPIVVPCHRVLAASGGIGGFSAPGGAATKARMLAIERARTRSEPGLFDEGETFSLAPRRRR